MSAQIVASIPSGEDVALLTAPFFVGSLLNCLLFGTLMVQVYLYSMLYPRDGVGMKAIVYGLFILDVIQTIFGTHTAWSYLISGWGNPAVLFQPPWSFTGVSITNAMISPTVQIFFAVRIWKLKRTWLAHGIAVLIVLVALMQSISLVVAAIQLALVGNNVLHVTSFIQNGFITGTASGFVADALIAGSQIAILWEARSKSPFKHTETIVTKLIIHTVQTAAVTAISSLVWLVLYTAMPNNFLSVTAVYMIGKLYSNVLLANLNARSPGTGGTSLESGTYPLNSVDVVHITTNPESPHDWNKSARIKEAAAFS